ncbi:MAG: ATP-dependent Clp protease proteolytic subunit [Spirochaetia bacterium]|nr:ATP-dependent Clp protease proteolytic subunit [Spirochaetia bacterium]
MLQSVSRSKEEQTRHSSHLEESIATRHLEDRRIFLWGPVEDSSAKHLIDRLLLLSQRDPKKEITLFIQSPGGANVSGMAILDVMNLIEAPVSTVCLGMAASFGALLLVAGEPGRRFALPNSRIMLHQPHIMGRLEAVATDLRIHAEEIRKDRERINRIIADRSGMSLAQIEKDTDRDFWLSSQEAMQYGIIDGILSHI